MSCGLTFLLSGVVEGGGVGHTKAGVLDRKNITSCNFLADFSN
jgi:hypothetical protein